MKLANPIFTHHPAAPSCHASTIVEWAPGQFLAAWFAGTYEGHPDTAIWLARYDHGKWDEPITVANEPGVPHWNPVLFCDERRTIWLFYKVGSPVSVWTGVSMRSHDGGCTWSSPVMLPAGLIGPTKNKPITVSNGDILCGSSNETWQAWACWVEISSDGGHSWKRSGPLMAPGAESYVVSTERLVSAVWDEATGQLMLPQHFSGVIQPTLWEYAPGRVKLLMRATQRVGRVCASASEDYGQTWSTVEPTDVPNPNSGLDAVRLKDGRIVLACNPVPEGRSTLSLLVSADNGGTWPKRLDLERAPGEHSYPAIIQAEDGRLHVVATYNRSQIVHYIVDLTEL